MWLLPHLSDGCSSYLGAVSRQPGSHQENVIWGYCLTQAIALCLDEISQRGEVSSASTVLLGSSPNIVVDLHTGTWTKSNLATFSDSSFYFIYLTFWLGDMWNLSSLTRNGIRTPLRWMYRVLTTGPPGKFPDPLFLFGLSICLGFMFWGVLLLELYINLWMKNDHVFRNSWSKNCLWFKGKGFYESLKVGFTHLLRQLCYYF